MAAHIPLLVRWHGAWAIEKGLVAVPGKHVFQWVLGGRPWRLGDGDEVRMMKRDKWVHIKVSDQERSDWQRQAENEGVTLADLIRARMVTATVDREPRRRRADPALFAAMARIGNNLNQVAAWANTYKRAADAVPVVAALVALERAVRDVLAQHHGVPLSIAQNGAEGTAGADSKHRAEGEGHPGEQRSFPSLLSIRDQAVEEGDGSC